MTILLSQNNSRNYDYVKDSFSVILKVETSPFLLLYLVHGVNKKSAFNNSFFSLLDPIDDKIPQNPLAILQDISFLQYSEKR